MTLLPQIEKSGEHCRWILEVAVDLDGGISGGQTIGREHGPLESKVSGKSHRANARIGRRQFGDNSTRIVGAVVVREDDLERIAIFHLFEDIANRVIGPAYVAFLIEDRNQNGNELAFCVSRLSAHFV
ncbi:hypothetical protein ACVWWR_000096 [Bradyrhizobium sp. LM3.2]